jgi:hypothetical protein
MTRQRARPSAVALLTPLAWRMLGSMARASVIAAALVALAAGGCRDPRLVELREISDEVCACKTAACGEEAMKRVQEDRIASDHRAQKIAKKMMECLAKLYVADRPTTDPDAEAPATGSGAGSGAAPPPR